MKKISIIVPVYNSEKTLDVCIKSIQKQIFEDYEVIFVDDGSTDRSVRVIENYREKDERIHLFQKENGGVSSARNYGIREAGGKYLFFMDSDDYIPPYYLSEIMEIQSQSEDKIQVITGLQKFTCDEELYKIEEKKAKVVFLEKKDILKIYAGDLLNPPWNKLFRADIVKKYQLRFPEDISLGEDLVFNLNYIATGEITGFSVLPELQYYYRQGNEESLSRKYYDDYYKTQNAQYLKLRQVALDLEAPQEDMEVFNDRYGLFLFLTLEYNMRSENDFFKKMAKNSSILKKEEFKEWIRKNEKNRLIRNVYLSNDYFRVWCMKKILDKYSTFKNQLK